MTDDLDHQMILKHDPGAPRVPAIGLTSRISGLPEAIIAWRRYALALGMALACTLSVIIFASYRSEVGSCSQRFDGPDSVTAEPLIVSIGM